MPGLFDAIPVFFAQAGQAAAQAAPAAKPAEVSSMYYWIQFLPIPILFYFMFIRPNQQQERKRKDMLSALKKNDRVLTSAGIYGTVMSIDPEGDKVVLRIDDDRGVKVAFSRGSVVRVVEVSADKDKDKASAEKDKDKEKAAEIASPGGASK